MRPNYDSVVFFCVCVSVAGEDYRRLSYKHRHRHAHNDTQNAAELRPFRIASVIAAGRDTVDFVSTRFKTVLAEVMREGDGATIQEHITRYFCCCICLLQPVTPLDAAVTHENEKTKKEKKKTKKEQGAPRSVSHMQMRRFTRKPLLSTIFSESRILSIPAMQSTVLMKLSGRLPLYCFSLLRLFSTRRTILTSMRLERGNFSGLAALGGTFSAKRKNWRKNHKKKQRVLL